MAVGAWVAVGEGKGVADWVGGTTSGTSVIASVGAAGDEAQADRVKRVRMAQLNTIGQPVSLAERRNEIGV
jgi:hypothetical protein